MKLRFSNMSVLSFLPVIVFLLFLHVTFVYIFLFSVYVTFNQGQTSLIY